jgi:CRISPR system Cascade subunit CasD
VLVALRLEPADEEPTLDQLAAVLDTPERPLFIGRKPFLPSRPLRLGDVEATTVHDALATGLDHVSPRLAPGPYAAQWPAAEGLVGDALEEELTDERHWPAGVHAGLRRVAVGRIDWPGATGPTPAEPEPAA